MGRFLCRSEDQRSGESDGYTKKTTQNLFGDQMRGEVGRKWEMGCAQMTLLYSEIHGEIDGEIDREK